MRNLAVFLALTTSVTALATASHADTFVNGSFETGDLTGWTSGGGYWNGGPYPVPQDYLPGGAEYVASVQNNTVTNPGFDPQTDNQLRTVYAGSHSAQINNPITDNSVSVISQRVNNYTDPIIAFAYSAVLESSHGATDSDAFIITLTDMTTNETLYNYNLNSFDAPGTFTQSSAGWFYTDWITQSIDVSARQGHDFVLSLLANDCPYGGHAGYAYLDGFGSVLGGGGTGSGGGGTTGVFQYWDGSASGNMANGVIDGGDGTWNATMTNWTEPTGATNGAYNPNPGTAIFAGAPGTVTVDDSLGAISVNGLAFTVGGYQIVGDAITLAGPNVAIQVGNGTSTGTGFVTSIDSVLTGSAGLTKTDLGTLVLNGVNTYSGPTEVAGGTLIGAATSFGTGAMIIDPASTLIIDQEGSASFSNQISGTGNLVKTGSGTLQLFLTSPFSGPTSVVAGTLQANGSLPNSTVTVGNGATLAGIGSVGAVSALAGSIVAPGTGAGDIRTLSVNGPYTQAAGSTYLVDLTSTGASDKVAVTGAANLTTGANLSVNKTDASRYVLGQRYTVLTAAGGVTGRYALSGNTAVSLFYNLVENNDANNVYLDVAQTSSFASAGLTPNQIAAAAGADSTSGAGSLHTALGYLQTTGQARAAFDSISGEIHATVRAAGYEDSRFLREAVIDHLGQQTGKQLWFHGFGLFGRMNGDGNAARYRRDIGGLFVGADLIQSGDLRIGLLGGYSHSRLKVSDRLSNADADDAHAGVYAGIDGPIAFRGGASYTFRTLKTQRVVGFTGFSDALRAKYRLGIGQVFGEVGSKLGTGKVTVEPIAGIAYVHLDRGDQYESGGAARLELKAQNSGILFSTLGARFNADLSSGGGTTFGLKGLAAWRRAFNNRATLSDEAFIGGGDFTVAAAPIAKNVVALELGGVAKTTSGVAIGVSYSGQLGDHLADHGVKANVSVPF